MNYAKATVSALKLKVKDILEHTDWNTKGLPPEEVRKMIEVKSSFIRLDDKLGKTLEIMDAA